MNKMNVNAEHVDERLQAQAHVWNHMFNFINSMSLKCAIDLGIPDIIHNHGRPMTVTELVAALPMLNPTKACNINRLMRILVHSDFFSQQKLDDDAQEDGYVLTDASRLLLKDDPLSVSPFLKAMLDPVLTEPWHVLSTWFQNNDLTPFGTAHGKTLWDYGGDDPKLNSLFNEAMASDARLATRVLCDKHKRIFEGLNSLADVGGGTGTLGKAIADAFPRMECTVFDLPHVVADLEGTKNLKYVGGDMFKAIPAANAILLKNVLHNWNDDECLKILKECKKAMSSQDKERGRLIIIDMVLMKNAVNDNEALKTIETQLFFDMMMMVLLTGRERREEEWATLFFTAGFRDYKITPILGLRSLIEVYP